MSRRLRVPTADGGTPIVGLTDDTINISFIGADFVALAEPAWPPTSAT